MLIKVKKITDLLNSGIQWWLLSHPVCLLLCDFENTIMNVFLRSAILKISECVSIYNCIDKHKFFWYFLCFFLLHLSFDTYAYKDIFWKPFNTQIFSEKKEGKFLYWEEFSFAWFFKFREKERMLFVDLMRIQKRQRLKKKWSIKSKFTYKHRKIISIWHIYIKKI